MEAFIWFKWMAQGRFELHRDSSLSWCIVCMLGAHNVLLCTEGYHVQVVYKHHLVRTLRDDDIPAFYSLCMHIDTDVYCHCNNQLAYLIFNRISQSGNESFTCKKCTFVKLVCMLEWLFQFTVCCQLYASAHDNKYKIQQRQKVKVYCVSDGYF